MASTFRLKLFFINLHVVFPYAKPDWGRIHGRSYAIPVSLQYVEKTADTLTHRVHE